MFFSLTHGWLVSCLRPTPVSRVNVTHRATTAGFMIGDGAGVGKGRQLAGIILDAWMQGHKRHVWFSISPGVVNDTKRDLKWVFTSLTRET